ncbi:hypothetical protein ABZ801_38065 [Actinomadura sp. NPDC047616]
METWRAWPLESVHPLGPRTRGSARAARALPSEQAALKLLYLVIRQPLRA